MNDQDQISYAELCVAFLGAARVEWRARSWRRRFTFPGWVFGLVVLGLVILTVDSEVADD